MRMSRILKPLSEFSFWSMAAYALHTLCGQSVPFYETAFMMFIVWSLCLIIRTKSSRKLSVLFHILVVFFIASVRYVFEIMPVPVLILLVLHTVMSFASHMSGSEFMDRTAGAHVAAGIIIYAVIYVVGRSDMVVFYIIFSIFFTLNFVQNTVIRNEEHIDIISEYSVMDVHDVRYNSNKASLISCGITAIVSIGIGFLGRLRIFTEFFDGIRKSILGIFEKLGINMDFASAPKNDTILPGTVPDEIITEFEQYEPDPVWTVIGIVLTALILIYIIESLIVLAVRKYKSRVYMPDLGHEEAITAKSRKSRKTGRMHSDTGIRKSIRKIYKARIIKGRGKRNDDLAAKTPYEHRKKKQAEGVEISREFIDLYEKARYGDNMITKNDIKNMRNL